MEPGGVFLFVLGLLTVVCVVVDVDLFDRQQALANIIGEKPARVFSITMGVTTAVLGALIAVKIVT